jgi:hypothetical protein
MWRIFFPDPHGSCTNEENPHPFPQGEIIANEEKFTVKF